MFETHEDGRKTPYFSLPGEYQWGYVGVSLNMPWMLVSCSVQSEDGYSIPQCLMLSNVKQLIEIAQRKDVKIQFVDIVSPGYMNPSGRWKMEPLKEIWLRANSECPDQYENVFVLEDGALRIEMTAPPENKSSVEEKLFSLQI